MKSENKSKKVKRGKRPSQKRFKKEHVQKLMFIGANAAGLTNKTESLFRIVSLLKPGVIFIQETKARRNNKFSIDDYVCFDSVRTNSEGGGLLTAVHKALNPISVSSDKDFELLVVEASLNGNKVRLINGYGPQENLPEKERKAFYTQLDLQIKMSKQAGTLIHALKWMQMRSLVLLLYL